MALRLEVEEWAALTNALGVFIGQNEYLAADNQDGIFAYNVRSAQSLVEKLEGVEFMTYGRARIRTAVRNIADREIGLQKRLDGLR